MTVGTAVGIAYGVVEDDNLILKVCIDNNLNPTDNYQIGLKYACDRAAADALLYTLAGISVQEGGFTLTVTTAGITARLQALAKMYGWQDVLNAVSPTVNGFSGIW